MVKERRLLKERKEAKENFLSGEKYFLYEKNYNELRRHVQDEESRALYLLIFLSIVLFMTIGAIGHYDYWIRLLLYSMTVVNMGMLLYVMLGMGNKSKPQEEVFHMHITELDFQNKYNVLYDAWIRKHVVNSGVVVLTTILFLVIMYLMFFVGA